MKNSRKISGLAIIAVISLAALLPAGCSFIPADNGNNSSGPGSGDHTPDQTIPTPTEDAFSIDNLLQNVGNVTAVTIKPYYADLGEITIYYNGSLTLPTAAGNYPVTFNVAATNNWKAAAGLYAGKLRIYPENYYIFKTIDNLKKYLLSRPDNTADDPYYIVTDIQQFGGPTNSGAINSYGSLAFVINDLGKYVNLDLSGSRITDIPQSVSLDGNNITGITLPDNVTDIGSFTASGANFATIKLDSANSAYTVENEVLYNKNKTSLIAYPAGKADASFTIPDSVTVIGEGAFGGCQNLTDITMPKNFTAIGKNAFESCLSLTNIILPDSVTDIGEKAFYFCTSLENIIIPDNVTDIGKDAFNYCLKLKSVIIGNGVTNIGEGAFGSCDELASVTIGNKVTAIGRSAFSLCRRLTDIIIPDSVTSIGPSAFLKCGSLTKVTLSNKLTKIEDFTFNDCDSLPSITIPGSVTGIRSGAFLECFKLVSVTFQGSNTQPMYASGIEKPPFDGDLLGSYLSEYGGIGTYTRNEISPYNYEWFKNQ